MLKAVINFDLILSREFENSKRLEVLQEIKKILQKIYKIKSREIDINRGDTLQIVISSERALRVVLYVSAICRYHEVEIKAVIGLGVEDELVAGEKVGLGYGPVFIKAGESFDQLNSGNFFKIIREDEKLEDKIVGSYIQEIIKSWNSKLALHVCDFFEHIDISRVSKISRHGMQTKLENLYLEKYGQKINQSTFSKRYKAAKIPEVLELLDWWEKSLSFNSLEVKNVE